MHTTEGIGLIASGAMTIKPSGKVQTGPNVANTPGTEMFSDHTNDIMADTLKLKSFPPVPTTGLNESEELSMRNLVKIASQGTQEKDEMTNNTRESNADMRSN